MAADGTAQLPTLAAAAAMAGNGAVSAGSEPGDKRPSPFLQPDSRGGGGGGAGAGGTAAGAGGGTPASKLLSVAEEAELAEMGKRQSSGAVAAAAPAATPGAAGSGEPAPGMSLMPSGSGFSMLSGPSGPTPPPLKPSKPAQTLRQRISSWRQSASYIWWGLPTACKATLIVAGVVGARGRGWAGGRQRALVWQPGWQRWQKL